MRKLSVAIFFCVLALSSRAQQVSPSHGEFAVMRTDRVTVNTGETTHLDCSVVGTGDTAQLSCESHTSGGGIPLVYHVALVVGSDKVGYVVSCGGGLVWRISCHPLSAGQVIQGYVEGGKLHVPAGKKTNSYRIETSTYIGPIGKGSSAESATATAPPGAPETAPPEPSVKLAVHTERSGRRKAGAAQSDSAEPSSPANNAKVMVSSEPTGGDIYVDGNFMGNTPSLIELPAGSHTIRVEAKGEKPCSLQSA